MVEATRQHPDRLCTACFTGVYPVPLPSADLLGKHALEQPPGAGPHVTDITTPRPQDADGVTVGLSVGGAGALSHP
jgi:amidophosphoribosyltransferase